MSSGSNTVIWVSVLNKFLPFGIKTSPYWPNPVPKEFLRIQIGPCFGSTSQPTKIDAWAGCSSNTSKLVYS